MYETGKFSRDECRANCTFVPEDVEQVEGILIHYLFYLLICLFVLFSITVPDEEKNEKLCTFFDEDDCRFAFVYWYDENNEIKIKAQTERECPPKVCDFNNFIMKI